MKTRIIAVANHKGGVGKTTTVANLGSILSMKGHRVLLVDLDAQANLTASLVASPEGVTIYEALTGRTDRLPVTAINDRLHLVPASLTLAMADVELSTAIAREHILAGLLTKANVENNYDYVLLDCPPSLGLVTLNAITASTDVLIPLISEVLPFKGLTMMSDFISMENSKLARGIEERLRGWNGDVVYQCKIRKNVRLAEAPLQNCNILDYASDSNGAKDYTALADEFLERMNQRKEVAV